MNIYSDNNILFFSSYNSKRLLHDSVIRTSDGYRSFCQGFFLKGVANILLARIETAGAFLLAALYAIPLIAISIVITPVFLAAAIPLNLASRIPGISSFESVQHFTSESEDAIFRIIKETLIVLPVIFLFLSGAAINVIPGVLGEENIFFSSVDWLVESLGRLKTICAVVDDRHFEGMRERATILTALEEYLRAFSTKNYLEEIPCDSVWYHSTVSY